MPQDHLVRTDPEVAPALGARCRGCAADQLHPVVSFGMSPLADVLLTAAELDRPEQRFPLDLGLCRRCSLLQLVETVPPDVLYRGHYPYYSSLLPGLVARTTASAEEILAARELGPDSLVVEAASNDGYMLRVFADHGVGVLGIDPAAGPAAMAEEVGVPTIVDYFSADLCRRLASGGRRADVVLGNSVVNLVPDPNDFAAGVDALASPDGVAVLEVPYAADLIDGCLYDSVFHANVSYFTLTSLDRLFRRHRLSAIEVERIDVFGGSLRVVLGREDHPSDAVRALLADEAAKGVDSPRYYADFAARVAAGRAELVELLRDLRRAGKRIAAYGAAGGMATTLLTYAGLDHELIDFAVDVNRHKQGLFTAGSRIEIHPPERLLEAMPDYVLLLAWNYADEILADQAEYRRRGGRFIVPVPAPRII